VPKAKATRVRCSKRLRASGPYPNIGACTVSASASARHTGRSSREFSMAWILFRRRPHPAPLPRPDHGESPPGCRTHGVQSRRQRHRSRVFVHRGPGSETKAAPGRSSFLLPATVLPEPEPPESGPSPARFRSFRGHSLRHRLTGLGGSRTQESSTTPPGNSTRSSHSPSPPASKTGWPLSRGPPA
jgi:hypothetical protein